METVRVVLFVFPALERNHHLVDYKLNGFRGGYGHCVQCALYGAGVAAVSCGCKTFAHSRLFIPGSVMDFIRVSSLQLGAHLAMAHTGQRGCFKAAVDSMV